MDMDSLLASFSSPGLAGGASGRGDFSGRFVAGSDARHVAALHGGELDMSFVRRPVISSSPKEWVREYTRILSEHIRFGGGVDRPVGVEEAAALAAAVAETQRIEQKGRDARLALGVLPAHSPVETSGSVDERRAALSAKDSDDEAGKAADAADAATGRAPTPIFTRKYTQYLRTRLDHASRAAQADHSASSFIAARSRWLDRVSEAVQRSLQSDRLVVRARRDFLASIYSEDAASAAEIEARFLTAFPAPCILHPTLSASRAPEKHHGKPKRSGMGAAMRRFRGEEGSDDDEEATLRRTARSMVVGSTTVRDASEGVLDTTEAVDTGRPAMPVTRVTSGPGEPREREDGGAAAHIPPRRTVGVSHEALRSLAAEAVGKEEESDATAPTSSGGSKDAGGDDAWSSALSGRQVEGTLGDEDRIAGGDPTAGCATRDLLLFLVDRLRGAAADAMAHPEDAVRDRRSRCEKLATAAKASFDAAAKAELTVREEEEKSLAAAREEEAAAHRARAAEADGDGEGPARARERQRVREQEQRERERLRALDRSRRARAAAAALESDEAMLDPESDTAIVASQPDLRLLALLQRDLLVRVRGVQVRNPLFPQSDDGSPEAAEARHGAVLDIFCDYVKAFLQASVEVVSTVPLGSGGAGGAEASQEADQSEALRGTLVGMLGPSLVGSIVELLEGAKPETRIASLADSCDVLMQLLEKVNMLCPDVPTSSGHQRGATDASGRARVRIVESAHPYQLNTTEERDITVPGATHLCIAFDNRCQTEASDFLTFTTADGEQVGPPCAGGRQRGSSWPAGVLLVPGSSVRLKFVAKSLGPGWGYRVFVRPMFLPDESASWAPGFARVIQRAIAQCLRAHLVGQQPSALEVAQSRWLNSPLLAGGLETSAHSPAGVKGEEDDSAAAAAARSGHTLAAQPNEKFLREILERGEETAGAALMQLMHDSIPRPTGLSGKRIERFGARPAIAKALQFVTAALLKQTGLLSAAEALSQSLLSAPEGFKEGLFRPSTDPVHANLQMVFAQLMNRVLTWLQRERQDVYKRLPAAKSHQSSESKETVAERESKDDGGAAVSSRVTGAAGGDVSWASKFYEEALVVSAVTDRAMFLLNLKAHPEVCVGDSTASMPSAATPIKRSVSAPSGPGNSTGSPLTALEARSRVATLARQQSADGGVSSAGGTSRGGAGGDGGDSSNLFGIWKAVQQHGVLRRAEGGGVHLLRSDEDAERESRRLGQQQFADHLKLLVDFLTLRVVIPGESTGGDAAAHGNKGLEVTSSERDDDSGAAEDKEAETADRSAGNEGAVSVQVVGIAESLKRVLDDRRRRASRRLDAIRRIHRVLGQLGFTSSGTGSDSGGVGDVARVPFAESFALELVDALSALHARKVARDPSRGHPLSGLEGCGGPMEAAIQKAFYALSSDIAAIVVNDGAPSGLRIAAMTFLALEWQAEDHEFVMGTGLIARLHEKTLELSLAGTGSPRGLTLLDNVPGAVETEERIHDPRPSATANESPFSLLYQFLALMITCRFAPSQRSASTAMGSEADEAFDPLERRILLQVVESLDKVTERYVIQCCEAPSDSTVASPRTGSASTLVSEESFEDPAVASAASATTASHLEAQRSMFATEATLATLLRLLACATAIHQPNRDRGRAFLASSVTVKTLFSLVQFGTPRLQLQAARLLRQVFGSESLRSRSAWDGAGISLQRADKELATWRTTWQDRLESRYPLACRGGFFDGGPTFIGCLLRWIGSRFTLAGEQLEVCPITDGRLHAVHHGAEFLAFTSELVCFCRCLLASAEWRRAMLESFSNSLCRLPDFVDERSPTLSQPAMESLHADSGGIIDAFAALAVIGGHTDVLRVGGRVERVTTLGGIGGGAAPAPDTVERGTVVHYDRLEALASVVFDSNPKRVLQCSLQKLRPVPEVGVDPSIMPLRKKHVPGFMVFVRNMSDATSESGLTVRHVLYSQLQGLALGALCLLLKHAPSAATLFAEDVLSTLMHVAVSPCTTEGLEFATLHQMQLRANRLRELLHDCAYLCSNLPDARSAFNRATGSKMLLSATNSLNGVFGGCATAGINHVFGPSPQEEVVPHCPFASRQVKLPTLLDRSSARGLEFSSGRADRALRCVRAQPGGGVAVADQAVPMSLPSFYFEVHILSLGMPPKAGKSATADVGPESSSGSEMGGGGIVSVGLTRLGMDVSNVPGCNNSFAYANDGMRYHSSTQFSAEGQLFGDMLHPFEEGSVVGCGWDLRAGHIFFTLNGDRLAAVYEGFKGRDGVQLVPTIWLSKGGAIARVNFGQAPFTYDFASTIAEDETKPGAGGPALGERELMRRTAAETLMAIFPDYPLELCVIALEQSHDDMEAAGTWLAENGFRELERMFEEIIRKSQMEAEAGAADDVGGDDDMAAAIAASAAEAAGAAAGGGDDAVLEHPIPDDDDDDHWRALEDDVAADEPGAPSSGDAPSRGDRFGSHGGLSPPGGSSGGAVAGGRDLNSWLDDEVDADIPVGVDPTNVGDGSSRGRRGAGVARAAAGGRRSGGAERVALGGAGGGGAAQTGQAADASDSGSGEGNSLRVEDLLPGMVVYVTDSVRGSRGGATASAWMSGRIGIIGAVDVNKDRAHVTAPLDLLASEASVWLPVSSLARVVGLWEDPCAPLLHEVVHAEAESALAALRRSFVETQIVAGVRQMRRTVMSLLATWPDDEPFRLSRLGGTAVVLKLLRLTASECLPVLSDRRMTEEREGRTVLSVWRQRLTSLIADESFRWTPESGVAPAELRFAEIRGGEDVAASDASSGSRDRGAAESPEESMTRLLAEEAVRHFVRASENPPPVVACESKHPYESYCDERGEVNIPGSGELVLNFDGRTRIASDALTALVLCRDEQCQDQFQRFAARGRQWAAFPRTIVDGSRFYYRFRSGPTDDWGFRFTATPRSLRLKDSAALAAQNFELGVWLLDLLLKHAPSYFRHDYIVDVFDAVVLFCRRTRGGEARSRGFEVLIRVLQEATVPPSSYPRDRRIDLRKLRAVRSEMARVAERERSAMARSSGIQLHSTYLQSLVELMVAAHMGRLPSTRQDAAISDADAGGKEEDGETSDVVASPLDVGRIDLNIHRAMYGKLAESADGERHGSCVDVTDMLRALCSRCGGGAVFVIPERLPQLRINKSNPFGPADGEADAISTVDPAPGEGKKLRVWYSVRQQHVHAVGDGLVSTAGFDDERVVTANDGQILALHAAAPWFYGVVETSELAKAVLDGKPAPASFIAEAYRLAAWATPEPIPVPVPRALADARTIPLSPSSGFSVPDWGNVGLQFTLRAWFYFAASPGDEPGGAASRAAADAAKAAPRAPESAGAPKAGRPRRDSDRSAAELDMDTDDHLEAAAGDLEAVDEVLGQEPSRRGGEVRTRLLEAMQALQEAEEAEDADEEQMTELRSAVVRARRHAQHYAERWSSSRRGRFGQTGYDGGESTIDQWVLLKGSNASGCRWPGLQLIKREGHAGVALRLSVGRSGEIEHSATRSGCVPIGKWVSVAITCDSLQVKLFVDGKMEATLGVPESVRTGNRGAIAGVAFNGAPDPLFIGALPDAVCAQPERHGTIPTSGVHGEIAALEFVAASATDDEIAAWSSSSHGVASEHRENRSLAADQAPSFASTPPAAVHVSGSLSAVAEFAAEQREWTWEADGELLEAVHSIAEALRPKRLDSDISGADLVAAGHELFDRYALLRGEPVSKLARRLVVLRLLNSRVGEVLPLVDFGPSRSSWSLAHRLSGLRERLFLSTKDTLWRSVLSATMSRSNMPNVRVNRAKTIKAKTHGDPEGKRTLFGQLFRQLHFLSPVSLRLADRTWHVDYEGEGAIDAGGVFRDSISHMCNDLQSSDLPLMVRCANASGFGDNQDKWLPSPACTSSLHLSMLSFVGKLMGIAMRGKHILNLDLAPLVWKKLVGSPVNTADLLDIDALTYNVIQRLRDSSDLKEETFEMDFQEYFVTVTADGRQVELVPGGASRKVTWENRMEYADLVEKHRLGAYDRQIDAIRQGLGTIVPVQLLPLFTWRELELQVCGRRELDIDFLMENTKYRSPMSADNPHVKRLFDVLREFTAKEQELFLRFVWGRSRLPLSTADFTQKFEIMPTHRPVEVQNDMLPLSHTCFFQLELPQYDTQERLRDKLLYAITACVSIDTDGGAAAAAWAADDEE